MCLLIVEGDELPMSQGKKRGARVSEVHKLPLRASVIPDSHERGEYPSHAIFAG